jgi:hypothetical protein
MNVEHRAIGDDEWLTQVGTRKRNGSFKFHNAPRAWRDPPEEAISWVIGRLDPAAARVAAFGPSTSLTPGNDAARHAQAGALRSAGFRVDHDPYPLSPDHVLIRWLGEEEWDDKVGDLLQSCCTGGEA